LRRGTSAIIKEVMRRKPSPEVMPGRTSGEVMLALSRQEAEEQTK